MSTDEAIAEAVCISVGSYSELLAECKAQRTRAEKAEARAAEAEAVKAEVLECFRAIAALWIGEAEAGSDHNTLAERMGKLALAATLRRFAP